jgi:hypothetical protein
MEHGAKPVQDEGNHDFRATRFVAFVTFVTFVVYSSRPPR